MCEYLFRGRRKGNGEWIHGSLISLGDRQKVILPSESKAFMPAGKNVLCSAECYEVIPETVGPYIGLEDKNGKRIFEGDVVQDVTLYYAHLRYVDRQKETIEQVNQYRHRGNVEAVTFHTEDIGSCGCCFPAFVGSGFKADGVDLTCCVVVGNIHDNPELLEGGEEDG